MSKLIENNKFQNIIEFCLKNITVIISIIVAIIGVLSIFITAYFNTTFYHPDELTHFKYTIGIIEILVSIAVIALIIFIVKKILKKIPSKILLILLLIASSILFVFWVRILKLNPETDQKMIHDMAISFLEGNIKNFTRNSTIFIFISISIWVNFFCSFNIQNLWTRLYEYFNNKLYRICY